jgi:GT2 family glycosyltransferase
MDRGRDSEPDVRIGIVAWNVASLLDECLSALPAALEGVRAEVVVVDNASSDGSAEVAARHGVEVVRNQENVGYARAANQALSGSRAPALVALNPDTVPCPGSLSRLTRLLLDSPADVGLIAPALLNPDGSPQHSVNRFPGLAPWAFLWFTPRFVHRTSLGQRFWLPGVSRYDRAADIDWAIGAVHAIRAAALDGRAPYDERWFMYVEDIELCWWLAQHGWKRRLEPSVRVVHVGNASGVQAWGNQRFRRYMEPSYQFFAEVRGPRAMRAWAAINLLGTGLWAGRQSLAGLVRFRRSRVRAALATARAELPVHYRVLSARRRTRRPLRGRKP